jgi:hypothetical protein
MYSSSSKKSSSDAVKENSDRLSRTELRGDKLALSDPASKDSVNNDTDSSSSVSSPLSHRSAAKHNVEFFDGVWRSLEDGDEIIPRRIEAACEINMIATFLFR